MNTRDASSTQVEGVPAAGTRSARRQAAVVGATDGKRGGFRTPVRGYPFAAAPPGADRPAPGQPARLVREPANPADPHAVAVWVEPDGAPAWRIGYLDRFVASRLAPQLDAGLRARAELDGWVTEPDERWQRPLLRVLTAADRPRDSGGHPPATDADRPRLWGRPPGVRRRTVGS